MEHHTSVIKQNKQAALSELLPIDRYCIEEVSQCEHCSDDDIAFDDIERDPHDQTLCMYCRCTVWEGV